ncbi:MAG: thioredoxin family protein [Myxococcota bacterium]
MDGVPMLIGFLVTIAAIFVLQLWATLPRTRRGEPLPDEARSNLPPEVGPDAALFFHSPGCGPCKAMRPHVDRLAEERDDVFVIDVRDHFDAVRALGIRGTPTVVVLRDGVVTQAQTGFLSDQALRRLVA